MIFTKTNHSPRNSGLYAFLIVGVAILVLGCQFEETSSAEKDLVASAKAYLKRLIEVAEESSSDYRRTHYLPELRSHYENIEKHGASIFAGSPILVNYTLMHTDREGYVLDRGDFLFVFQWLSEFYDLSSVRVLEFWPDGGLVDEIYPLFDSDDEQRPRSTPLQTFGLVADARKESRPKAHLYEEYNEENEEIKMIAIGDPRQEVVVYFSIIDQKGRESQMVRVWYVDEPRPVQVEGQQGEGENE